MSTYPVLLVYFGDVESARAEHFKWTEIDAAIQLLADVHNNAVFFKWPYLELEKGGLESVCDLWRVSWNNAKQWIQSQPRSTLQWTYCHDEGEVRSLGETASVAFVKAYLGALLPHVTPSAELAEWLPDPDCCEFDDIINDSGILPSLSTFVSLAAENIGEKVHVHLSSFFNLVPSSRQLQSGGSIRELLVTTITPSYQKPTVAYTSQSPHRSTLISDTLVLPWSSRSSKLS